MTNLQNRSWRLQHSSGRALANAQIPPTAPTFNAGSRKEADPASKQKLSGEFPVSAIIWPIFAISPPLSFIPTIFGCFESSTAKSTGKSSL